MKDTKLLKEILSNILGMLADKYPELSYDCIDILKKVDKLKH